MMKEDPDRLMRSIVEQPGFYDSNIGQIVKKNKS